MLLLFVIIIIIIILFIVISVLEYISRTTEQTYCFQGKN